MTQIKVDTLTDAAGTGAPDFADGVTYEGGALSSLNTFEYYSTGTEPSTANDGAIWWDTGNDKVFMFIADEWKEVELGASGAASWTVDLSNVTYDSVGFNTNSQDSTPSCFSFKPDGTKMYVVGGSSDSVYQYSLSTAWDITTVSYDNKNYDHSSEETTNGGIEFKPDGTKMYISGNLSDKVHQYTLSTAWDVSTASYDNVALSLLVGNVSQPKGVTFSADGSKMFMASYSADDAVYQFSLSTPYDVSTGSYDNVFLDVSVETDGPYNSRFNPDGTQLFVICSSLDEVFSWTLTSPYDLTTATYDGVSFATGGNSWDVDFNSDGTKMYICDPSANVIYQYSTGL
jgi:uncharacterized protein YkuJ